MFYLALAFLLAPPWPAEARQIPDEVMVRFSPGTAETEARRAMAELGGRETGLIPEIRLRLVKLPPGLAVETAISRLLRNPNVLSAEPNHVMTAKTLPNDPYFSFQWSLDRIQARSAWVAGVPGSEGSDAVVIAVADTGIDARNPDLAGKLVAGYNAFDGSGNAQDDNGHGTAVAGIAAASSNNGLGITGVAWKARLMPVKVLDAAGNGNEFLIAQGIVWAAEHGARVINMSFGSCQVIGGEVFCETPTQAFQAATDLAWSRGAVLVAATGNENTSKPSYPASYPHVLGVGATDNADLLARYSNFGGSLDVVAPGGGGSAFVCDPAVDILSLALTATRLDCSAFPDAPSACGCAFSAAINSTLYVAEAGTSAAAPIVSGLSAVVLGLHPDWTPDRVMTLIEATADAATGQAGWTPNYGYGRVNMLRALAGDAASPPASTTPAWVFPNPFSPVANEFTTFVLPNGRGQEVSIEIRDSSGLEVWSKGLSAAETAGMDLYFNSTLRWNGRDSKGRSLANGVYAARIRVGPASCVKRIAISR